MRSDRASNRIVLAGGLGRAALRPGVAWLGIAAILSGCAQAPEVATRWEKHGREYFSTALYGPASPRVAMDGQPIPRGGGQYLVGRPYTIAGRTYVPRQLPPGYSQVGLASWYGDAFNGRRTANGEVYDMDSVSAAHPTMPLPSYARVTNLGNHRSIIVRVNDRGPYHSARIMDVSSRVADALDFKRFGTATVKVEYIGPAGLGGSDDARLMASLRTDGQPARLDGMPDISPTMVASAEPSPPPPSLVPLLPPSPRVERAMARESVPPPYDESPVAEPVDAPLPPLPPRPGALPRIVPLPPSRPFDLSTIPGADQPLASGPRYRESDALSYAPFGPRPPRRWPHRRLRPDDAGWLPPQP